MSEELNDLELLTRSRDGDRVALCELLTMQFKTLAMYLSLRIPPAMQAKLDTDDVVQETLVQVIRDINDCKARTSEAFVAWLKAIADHRLQDFIRRHETKKRGGDRYRVTAARSAYESSLIEVVEMLSAGSHRPSRSAVRHEAIAAIHNAIEALPEGYRQAIQLRMLEGKSLEESAAIMNRTQRAVQGLVDRGKKKLQASLGRMSLYE